MFVRSPTPTTFLRIEADFPRDTWTDAVSTEESIAAVRVPRVGPAVYDPRVARSLADAFMEGGRNT